MARTVVSPPVVFAAPPTDFRGSTAKEAAEAGRWITVGHGEDAHHLFLPAGGFAALKREKLGPGETHHIVSGGKAFGDKSEPKVGQTFFHAGSKQYLTTVRTDSHSIGPAERTGYGLLQGHAVAHHTYARPATEEEAAPHKDAEAAKAKLVGADVLRDALKQRFRKGGQAIGDDERVDAPEPGKTYQIHVGSALHLQDRATDFLSHTRQQKRDNDVFYVTPTRTALLDAKNDKKYVLPTTPELIGHIAHIENIRAEGEHNLASAYGRQLDTERRVRQGLARHSADGPALFAAPPVAFNDYPYGPEEGHWVTIDGEHVLIRGGRPGEHEHGGHGKGAKGGEGEAGGEEAHVFRPAGAPVSEALTVQHSKHLAPVHAVSAAIDSVHGDGVLLNIPVKTSAAKGFFGKYTYLRGPNGKTAPNNIAISTTQQEDHKHLTTAHEIGHFIDNAALAQPGYSFGSWQSSNQEPEMRALMDTIGKTDAVSSLKQQLGVRGDVQVAMDDGSQRTYSPNRQYVEYSLRPHEQFARAYAQYIATRSGHPAMKTELEDHLERQKSSSAPIRYTTQWEHGDFAPVAELFDKLFESKGWRK